MYLLKESMAIDPSWLRRTYSLFPVVQAMSPLNVDPEMVGVQDSVSTGVHPAHAMPITSSAPQ